MHGRTPPHRSIWAALVAIGIASVVVIGAITIVLGLGRPGSTSGSGSGLATVTNETAALGPTFHPGAILSGGSNETTTFFGGIGVYLKPEGRSLPVLALARPGGGAPEVSNSTSLINSFFWHGGVYSIVWNGSGWLLTGQAGWGGVDTGTALFIDGSRLTNLTPLIGSMFPRGGVWTAGWNGTAWLMGGNSTGGPVLLSLEGNRVANLTSEVSWHGFPSWFQYMEWNGHEWLLGGNGILGLLRGRAYVDLFPGSPFVGAGVYSGGWNGTTWLVGGGSGDVSCIVGSTLTPGPVLPEGLDQSVLAIQPVGSNWVIAGKGSTPAGGIAPGLASWNGTPGREPATDLSALLPGSFGGGEIWGAVPLPAAPPSAFYLVGIGAYNFTTGYGTGALALLVVNHPAAARTASTVAPAAVSGPVALAVLAPALPTRGSPSERNATAPVGTRVIGPGSARRW